MGEFKPGNLCSRASEGRFSALNLVLVSSMRAFAYFAVFLLGNHGSRSWPTQHDSISR